MIEASLGAAVRDEDDPYRVSAVRRRCKFLHPRQCWRLLLHVIYSKSGHEGNLPLSKTRSRGFPYRLNGSHVMESTHGGTHERGGVEYIPSAPS